MSERVHKYPKSDTSRWGRFRDVLAWNIATFAFNWIATPWYRATIGGSITLGLEAARQEARNERAIPTKALIRPTTETEEQK